MTFFNARNSPVIIIVFFIFLFIIIAGLTLAEPFLRNQLEKLVKENLGSAYELSVERLDASLIPLSIEMKDVNLSTPADTGDQKQVDVFIEGLEISGLSLWDYLFNDQLSLGCVRIEGLSSTFSGMPEVEGKDEKSEKPFTRLEIGTFEALSASFHYYDSLPGEKPRFSVIDGNVAATGFIFNLDDRSYALDDIETEISGIDFNAVDGLHAVHAEKIHFSKIDSFLEIDSLVVTPLLKPAAFASALTHEKSRISLLAPVIRLTGLDFETYIQKKEINISSVVFDKPAIEIHRDKNPPDNPEPGRLPSEIVQKLETAIRIDSIVMREGSITYHEKPEKSLDYGHVFFQDLNAKLTGFSSIDELSSNLTASAYLMGAGLLQVEISYPNGLRQDTFIVNGGLGTMSLAHLNPMTVNAAFARIDEGLTQQMDFRLRGNSRYAAGEMYFTYSGMKLTLLKKTKDGEKVKRQAGSLFANMIVSDSNPKKGDYRVGEIFFERKEKKSIFNYWWKSLFSGIKSSAGLKDRKE